MTEPAPAYPRPEECSPEQSEVCHEAANGDAMGLKAKEYDIAVLGIVGICQKCPRVLKADGTKVHVIPAPIV